MTNVSAVANFRILCKTTQAAPQQYLATVAAIEAEEQGEGVVRAETRIFRTLELASSECRQMAAHMKERLTKQGHVVISIDVI